MSKVSIGRVVVAGLTAITAAGVLMTAAPASAGESKSVNGASITAVAPKGTMVQGPASHTGGVSVQHLDGVCNQYSSGVGDFCLWYFQNFTGSLADFFVNDCNLNDNFFITAGAGQGQRVGNNAESDWNFDLVFGARVWTGVNCTGTTGVVPQGSGGNFNLTYKNNVEGLQFV